MSIILWYQQLETEVISVYDGKIIVNCSVYQGNTDAIFQDSLKLMVKGESENGEEYLIKGKHLVAWIFLDIMLKFLMWK